ncbi:MAG: hypothetical protein L6R43_16930 [Planctomycetes bacterium]|nr:hypothetical protein [Planctomycetota bacterium]
MSTVPPTGAAPGPQVPPAEGGSASPAGVPGNPPADRSTRLLQGAVLGLFLAVCAAGTLRIQERVSRLEDFQVDLSRVRVEGPRWLPAEEAAALGKRAAPGGKAPILREGLPEFLAGRLETDPRVVRVLGARRVHPDAVEIAIQVRRPVALVEAEGRLAAVDGAGIRLPGDYRTLPLPRIRGGGGGLPDEGRPFDRTVREGASVAAALPADLAADLGIAVLDVSGVEKGEGVVLRRGAAAGTGGAAPKASADLAVVEWGRAPLSKDAVLDPSPASKVARLRLATQRFPGLRGLRSVRLGFDELVVVPL